MDFWQDWCFWLFCMLYLYLWTGSMWIDKQLRIARDRSTHEVL